DVLVHTLKILNWQSLKKANQFSNGTLVLPNENTPSAGYLRRKNETYCLPLCLERSRGMRMPLLNHEFYPDKEQNDRADDRHDETGGRTCGHWIRFGKETADQSAQNRATDPEERRHYETEMLRAMHDGPCDQADNETDDYVPEDVQHRLLVLSR